MEQAHRSPEQPDDAASRNEEGLLRLNRQLREQAEELQKLNRELTDGEQRLRLAIETGRIGLWVWNSTDVANSGDWSPRLKEIFGLPPDTEVTHELFLQCVHAEDRERVNRAVMDALAGVNGGTYQAEYRTINPNDGSLHWVTARAQAFFDPEGKPFRFIGTLMEITDRKEVEQVTQRMNQELEHRIAERTRDLEQSNASLKNEVREREHLAARLRASEQLARGQLETLKAIISSMSTEIDPERLLHHVLCIIARQVAGQSIAVYSRDEDDCLTGVGTYQNDSFHVNAREVRHPTQDQPLWRECLQTGTECLLTEFDREPIWCRLVNRPDLEGQPRLNGKSSAFAVNLHQRLKAQGVVVSLGVPMVISGRVSGFLAVRYDHRREFSSEEIELYLALAQQAALALQVMRLSRESQQAAVMAERNRLARDIHDTLAQGFTGVIAQLQAARGATNLDDIAAHIRTAETLARASLTEARRSVRALRPRSLSETGLSAALDSMLKSVGHYSGLTTEFTAEGEPRSIPAEWEEALLRIAQESLTNTIRHAQARNFRARLSFLPDKVQLALSDDGRGFVADTEQEGFGLIGMKERVDKMGGEFRIRSQPGHGTEIVVAMDCPDNRVNGGA